MNSLRFVRTIGAILKNKNDHGEYGASVHDLETSLKQLGMKNRRDEIQLALHYLLVSENQFYFENGRYFYHQ